jgi:GWxTD domain-containing protein
MKRRIVFPLLFGSLFAFSSFLGAGAGQVKAESLAPKYLEWVKVTSYIIRDKEREVFLKLATDRDRDVFIQMFWKIRDPTPATPKNEFQDEIFRRFKEANRRYRFGSTREGWMTDRGRMFITLGEPSSVIRVAGSNELFPAEIWSYYGDSSKNMPIHFSLVFYQWRNVGELKLYDPFVDGPYRLLVQTKGLDSTDYENMYDLIYAQDPDLAAVSLSIIPGEIPYAYRPSPEHAIMMANIIDSPKKAINDSYASHFLNYRGYVNSEYMTNYMESSGSVDVVFDPVSGLSFIDFAMAPPNLSLELYEPKSEYSCSFEINVSLRAGSKVVYQYAKEFPLTIPETRLAETEAMGVAIQDSFPAIPGFYKLTVLLQNKTGKEFSVFEREVTVPEAGGPPRSVGPVVGTLLNETKPEARFPYQAGTLRIQVDPKKSFASSDRIAYLFQVVGLSQDLWREGTVRIAFQGAKQDKAKARSFTVRLSDQPFDDIVTVGQTIGAAELPPDYYELVVTLLDGQGKVLDERQDHFIRSTQKTISHPIILSKGASQANRFVFDYILGYQFDQAGRREDAEAAYERALNANPAFLGKVPEYAGLLVRSKKFDRALALTERIKDDTGLVFQYRLIKGQALLGLERYEEAAASFQDANKIYNSDTEVLYGLGLSYWKTGRAQDALNVLNASLKLNPDQAYVRALIAEIEKL